MTIWASNCDTVQGTVGIQGAVYGYAGNGLCTNSTDQPDEILDCDGACPNVGPLTLNPTGMTIGKIYYFMIDGCAGSACDLTVSVDQKCGAPFIGDWTEPIQGPTLVCSGLDATYSIEPPIGAVEFYWYLDGVEIGAGSDNFIDITWTNAGTYELCVDAANQCISQYEFPDQTCITVEVYDVTPEDPDPVEVCENDTYTYAGQDYPVGVHQVNLTTPQGCDSLVELTVNEVPSVENDLGPFYICEQGSVTVAGVQFTAADEGPQQVVLDQFAPQL